MILKKSHFSTYWSNDRVEAAIVEFVDAANKFSSSQAKKIANSMASSFNRTKRAYELQNTTYRKSGSIDLGRIHSYKTSDDIFKRISMQPNGKNHGVLIVVDWSGSIQYSASKLAMQFLITAYFLKLVKIPFSVQIFTSGYGVNNGDTPNGISQELIRMTDLRQVEIANDSFSFSALQDVYNDMMLASHYNYISNTAVKTYIKTNYDFGGTPLAQSTVASYSAARKFRTERNVTNMSIMYITDGDGDRMRCNRTGYTTLTGITNPANGRFYRGKADGTCQMSFVNRMIRDDGIKIFNVYIDANTHTPTSFVKRNDDRDEAYLAPGLTNFSSAGICSVPGAAFYNSVIFVQSKAMADIKVNYQQKQIEDKGESKVEEIDWMSESTSKLKKALVTDILWMKSAALVGDLIVSEIVNEYANKK